MMLEHLGLGGDHLELPHPVGPDLGDVDRVPAAGERHVVRVVHGAAPGVHHRVVAGQVHGHTLALTWSHHGRMGTLVRLEITSYPVDQKKISKGPVDHTKK